LGLSTPSADFWIRGWHQKFRTPRPHRVIPPEPPSPLFEMPKKYLHPTSSAILYW